MTTTKKKLPYRDQLVAQIQRAGQELIDRAETMISPGCDGITEFRIEIRVDTGLLPEIFTTIGLVNKTEMQYHIRGNVSDSDTEGE